MRCRQHGDAIDRYFAGQLGAEDEARLRARLAACADCRAHYERHLVVEAALSPDDEPALDRIWRGVQRATRGEQLRAAIETPKQRGRSRSRWLALGGALAAAAVLIVARPRLEAPSKPHVSDPVARGGAALVPPALHVFRSVSPHVAEPLGEGAAIQSRAGLLFAYSNFDPSLTRLMIFAIDSAYGVHWYYPAFLREGENPEAVPVATGAAGVELGEEIRHELPPGPLRVVALFLPEPHGVLEIEELVKKDVALPRRALDAAFSLPVPGDVEVSVTLRVVP